MALLNLPLLKQATLQKEPFKYMVVPSLIGPEALDAINRDFPDIDSPMNIRLGEIECRGAFRDLIDEIRGKEFQRLLGKKFGVNVGNKELDISIRAFSSIDEGQIHTDAVKKVVTALVYLNKDWEHSGGRLRLLRSSTDIEDYFAEVPPDKGTLLAFKRCDCSYHGFKPFEGERRAIQLNWIESRWMLKLKEFRGRLSST